MLHRADPNFAYPSQSIQGPIGGRSAKWLWSLGQIQPSRRTNVAKGQQRSNKETRKPKKSKVKTIAANPSQKGGPRGLENLKND